MNQKEKLCKTGRYGSLTHAPLDSNTREGVIYYTDYENCVVADLELQGEGHQCTLWVRVAVENNIPQDCMDQFVDVCGVIVPENSQDMCADIDDVN
ncbi:hypothetical protein HPB51_008155 [Rhipicephalus microplus]|uniref:Lipocalin n=1 Tax=Rhipicephalus microplus TaxID=6941 RepID=A0A9J6D4F6_RHIMP|nr:hypothetical protein HPB51_008155 [Rhipicephalus microplus]